MATFTKPNLTLECIVTLKEHSKWDKKRVFRPSLSVLRQKGGRKVCWKSVKSFKSDEGGELEEKRKEKKGVLNSLTRFLLGVSGSPAQKEEYRNTMAKAKEFFFACATQIGRYLVTIMSTGVVLTVGFQLSGGDNQMDTLIWYSWLGGIIIGTMIGANMVLEEHYKKGPRNIVITGSTRGLGKALAREFLLSGDRVIIASRRQPGVCSDNSGRA